MADSGGGRGIKHKPIRPPTPDGSNKDRNRQNSQHRQFFDKRRGSVFQRLGGHVSPMKNKPTNKREEVCRNFQRNGSCPYGNKCIYIHPKNNSGRELQRTGNTFQQRRYNNQSRSGEHGKSRIPNATKRPLSSGSGSVERPAKRKREDTENSKETVLEKEKRRLHEFEEALQLEKRRLELQRELKLLEKDEPGSRKLVLPPLRTPSPSGELSSNGEVSSASEGEASSSGSSSTSSSDSDSDEESDDSSPAPPKPATDRKGSSLNYVTPAVKKQQQQQQHRGPPERDNRRNMGAPPEDEFRRRDEGLPSLLDINVPSPPKRLNRKEPYEHNDIPPNEQHRYRSPPPPLRDDRRIPYQERGRRQSSLEPPPLYEDRRPSRYPAMKEDDRDRYHPDQIRTDHLPNHPHRWSPGPGEFKDRRPPPQPLADRYRGGGDVPGYGIRRSSAERHEEYMRSLDDRTDRHTPNVGFDREKYHPDGANIRRSLSPRDRVHYNNPRQDDRNRRGGRQGQPPMRQQRPSNLRNAQQQQRRQRQPEIEQQASGKKRSPRSTKAGSRSRETSETHSPWRRKQASTKTDSPAKESGRERNKNDSDRSSRSPNKDRRPITYIKSSTKDKNSRRSSSQEPQKEEETKEKASVEKDLSTEDARSDVSPEKDQQQSDAESDTDSHTDTDDNKPTENRDQPLTTVPVTSVTFPWIAPEEKVPDDTLLEETKKPEEPSKQESEDVSNVIIPIPDDCLVEISDDELEEDGANADKNSEIGADRVDWTSLLQGSKPKVSKPSSIRQRFALHNFLRTVPFSKKYLGDKLVKEIENICNSGPKEGESEEAEPFRFDHEKSWQHFQAFADRQARKNLFLNKGTCGSALSARVDLRIRRTLCGLGPDFVEPVGSGEVGVTFNASLFEMAKKQFEAVK